MQSTSKVEQYLAFALFASVFVYLIIRAVNVQLVHDEVVTYFIYMHHGNWWPFKNYVDANNHLLFSALGNLFSSIVGHHLPLTPRVPSLLAFPVLAIYSWKIAKCFGSSLFNRWLFIIPLATAPYFIEFFALGRGYGLSMAFLIAGVFYLLRFLRHYQIHQSYLSLLFLTLALYSNLTLIFIAIIAFSLIAFQWFATKKERHSQLLLQFVLFGITTGWAVWYSLQLKNINKLYYGYVDSFVQKSLGSLSELLLFTKEPAILWAQTIAFLTVFVFAIVYLLKGNIGQNLKSRPTVAFPVLLGGSVCAILLANLILDVRFPSDRGLLYFFPLFTGSLYFIAQKLNLKAVSIPLFAIMMLFPVSLVLDMNTTHSLFWNQERIKPAFHQKIDSYIENNEFPPPIGGKSILATVWSVSKPQNTTYVTDLQSGNMGFYPDSVATFQLADTSDYPSILRHYTVIDHDSISSLSLLKRNQKLEKTFVEDTTYSNIKREQIYTDIFKGIDSSTIGKAVLLEAEVTLKTNTFPTDLQVIASAQKPTGEISYFEGLPFDLTAGEMQNGKTVRLSMYIPRIMDPTKSGFYILNKEKRTFEIIDLNASLYTLNETQNIHAQ
jgi:hypothetical protein